MAYQGKNPSLDLVTLTDQGASTVDTPDTGKASIVIRSGVAYVVDDTGTETQLLTGIGNIDYAAKSADYTITNTDSVLTVGVTTGSNNRTITLPAVASNTNRIITVKKVDSGSGSVTVDGAGAETIDGTSSVTLTIQYASVTVQSNGTSWVILDGSPLKVSALHDGTAAAPTFGFASDTDTGIYRVSADTLGIAAGGTLVRRISQASTRETFTLQQAGHDGSQSEPTYGFSGDTNTGMYRVGASQLGWAIGGATKLQLNTSGLNVDAGIQTNSGGYVKMQAFNGTLSGSGTTALSLSSSSDRIIGYSGRTTASGGLWLMMEVDPGSGDQVYFNNGTAASQHQLFLRNRSSSSRSYEVIVYYRTP